MYSIRPLYFCSILRNYTDKVHAIVYNACNFHCGFCNMHYRNKQEYIEYSEDEFVMIVSQLINKSRFFKFTGGEPTLNPSIYRDLKVVKDLGGMVFLDTNGSRPDVISNLIKDNLIDVFGFSIKGLTSEKACLVTKQSNPILCWNNVFKSIEMAIQSGKDTIVTHVFDARSTFEDLLNFVDLFPPYKNLYLKFNNVMFPKHNEQGWNPMEDDIMEKWISQMIKTRPKLMGKIVLVGNEAAITDQNFIKYL